MLTKLSRANRRAIKEALRRIEAGEVLGVSYETAWDALFEDEPELAMCYGYYGA